MDVALDITQIIDSIGEGVEILTKIQKHVAKSYAFVHKRTRAEIAGKQGYLVWDYFLWNEITFKEDDAFGGKMYSFGNRFSDKQTEELWNELVKKYGR